MRLRFSRLSLLTKIMLSTSVAVTVLFALAGEIVLRNVTRTMSDSLEAEVQGSFQRLRVAVGHARRTVELREPPAGQHVGCARGVRHPRPGHHPRQRERTVVADFHLRRDSSWSPTRGAG